MPEPQQVEKNSSINGAQSLEDEEIKSNHNDEQWNLIESFLSNAWNAMPSWETFTSYFGCCNSNNVDHQYEYRILSKQSD